MILSCRLPVHRFRLASDSGVSLLHDCSWAGSSLSFFIRSSDSSGRFRCGTSVSMLPEAFCSDKNITFVRTNWPGMDMEDDFGRSWRQDGPAEGPSAAVPERERQPDPQPVRPPSRFGEHGFRREAFGRRSRRAEKRLLSNSAFSSAVRFSVSTFSTPPRPVTELRTVGKAILLTTEAACTKRKTAAGKGRRFLKIT